MIHIIALIVQLQASSTPPENVPDYGDWLGARKFNGAWDGEDEWEDE